MPEQRKVVTATPENSETPLENMRGWVTPTRLFFVRNHFATPELDADSWRLAVEGRVRRPRRWTLDELTNLPERTVFATVECAGNGRSFYEPPVAGLQWGNGAVGNGRWRGVRLADVLKRAGIKESSRAILFDGADTPLGTMPDFQRSFPVKKALDSYTILAYEMNGETLPVKHGFPIRVVSP